LLAELKELARREAELTEGLEAILARETPAGDGSIGRIVARRLSITDRRLELLACWMVLIDTRVGRVESRLRDLKGDVSSHEEALKLLCEVVKQMDDPYGFGLSLDERIAGEASMDELED
jgi:hypothetical protein